MKNLSRKLSYVLRHKPENIGLKLDKNGWADIETLVNLMSDAGDYVTKHMIDTVVRYNDKQRFSYDETGTKIRANQGHSIKVDLNLKPERPPRILYHGAPLTSLKSIKKLGLVKMKRHHVHLSRDIHTAQKVGARRGDFTVLEINASHMYADAYKFYKSQNGVWLTDSVPVKYIKFKL